MPAVLDGGLTIKEAKFVRDAVETGDLTQAVMNNYNVKGKKSAYSMSKQLRRKPRIRAAVNEALEKKGLTPDAIADQLKTAITSGIGQKATNSDALRGIELYAKFTGAFDEQKMDTGKKYTLQKLPQEDLVNELKRRNLMSQTLINAEEGEVIVPQKEEDVADS